MLLSNWNPLNNRGGNRFDFESCQNMVLGPFFFLNSLTARSVSRRSVHGHYLCNSFIFSSTAHLGCLKNLFIWAAYSTFWIPHNCLDFYMWSVDPGCLQFLLVWILFLGLWSLPVILTEYSVGRFTRKAPVKSFRLLLGPWSLWCGGWMVTVVIFIA